MTPFNKMICRKCDCENPISFFAPVDNYNGTSSVICVPCAKDRGWLDKEDNIKPGYQV